VVQSKCPSYIGKSGILLKETENTFNIITKNDRLLSEFHIIYIYI